MNQPNPLPLWQTLQFRAKALAALRTFFVQNHYLEIETRALRPTTASDPYIESFKTQWCNSESPLYMQTSPEYAHKILLSHYRNPIFEVARVFRNEPHGALHRNEFTLVEWYHPDYDYRDMMTETESLIRFICKELQIDKLQSNAREKSHAIDLTPVPFERLTLTDAFLKYAGFSPLGMAKRELVDAATGIGSKVSIDWSWNDILNCILVDHIEPHLGMDHPTYLIDYPSSMASLAQVRHEKSGDIAERFELYICGIELCNGYSELNDSIELKKRFDEDNHERIKLGYDCIPDDIDLLNALPKLGKLGGNALGFDRLLMLMLACSDISEVRIDV